MSPATSRSSRRSTGGGFSTQAAVQSASNSVVQLYALVEWLTGTYKGTFTENVKLEWVQDYHGEDTFSESYCIEWRVPPMVRGGWSLWDGRIHYISDDLQFLKKRREELERSSDLSLSPTINSTSPDWKSIVDEAVKRALANTPRSRSQSQPTAISNSPSAPDPDTVVVGKKLILPKFTYTLAQSAPSPGRMVGLLLRQAFSRRRLISSSYAGQHRTRNGERVVKPMLKKYQKMADIQSFVLQRFPSMSQSNFGATVNSFLGEKPNKKREMELVEESESESEGEMD